MALPQDVIAQLDKFEMALERMEALMESYLSRNPRSFDSKLTPVQRANAHFAVAEGLINTYMLLLRAQGLDSKEHPIEKERERIKHYSKKIRKLESADFFAKNRPTTEINIAAAGRFINHAVPDLSKEQKQALKAVQNSFAQGQERKRKTPESRQGTVADQARAFLETLGDKSRRVG